MHLYDDVIYTLDCQQNTYVHAHINNISFPKTLDQLEYFIYKHGCFNVEDVINESQNGYTTWTVPRNSVIGDIVLFFHAKTAIQWIRKLETATRQIDNFDSNHDKALLFEWLGRARMLYDKYGGKIFAIGRIKSVPEYYNRSSVEDLHWTGRIYADIGDIVLMENPIDISEFNSFILVSRQSAITHLPANEYQRLKNIVINTNSNMPKYFQTSKIANANLSGITYKNYLEATRQFRKRFMLEIDFRSYYVNYFLQTVARKNYYRECSCHSANQPICFVDNVFKYKGKYFLLEVKLNISIEKNLSKQLDQYICADFVTISNDAEKKIFDYERAYMYVIDVNALYKYIPHDKQLILIKHLDAIQSCEEVSQLFTN